MELSYVSAEKIIFYYEKGRALVAHGCAAAGATDSGSAAMCNLKYRAARAFLIAPV